MCNTHRDCCNFIVFLFIIITVSLDVSQAFCTRRNNKRITATPIVMLIDNRYGSYVYNTAA